MARITLTPTFTVIPEGEYIFGIYDAVYDEEFGKMEIKLVTSKGLRHTERFMLRGQDDEPNAGAMTAYSLLARAAIGDFDLEEIDHADIIGKYIRGVIVHTTRPSKKDPTKTVTFANLAYEKAHADGFEGEVSKSAQTLMQEAAQKAKKAPVSAPDIDLDSLLG